MVHHLGIGIGHVGQTNISRDTNLGDIESREGGAEEGDDEIGDSTLLRYAEELEDNQESDEEEEDEEEEDEEGFDDEDFGYDDL